MATKFTLIREERETIIRSSAADSEWEICTADPRFLRYLRRQGYEPVPDHQFPDYFSCKVPCNKVRIFKPRVAMSAEQRLKLAERFKAESKNRAAVDMKIIKT